jgi:hypothetical protein
MAYDCYNEYERLRTGKPSCRWRDLSPDAQRTWSHVARAVYPSDPDEIARLIAHLYDRVDTSGRMHTAAQALATSMEDRARKAEARLKLLEKEIAGLGHGQQRM